MICKWTIREGNNNTYWSYTPCKRGFNYLSRVNSIDRIKPQYDGRICPICGNIIECNLELLDKEEVMNIGN